MGGMRCGARACVRVGHVTGFSRSMRVRDMLGNKASQKESARCDVFLTEANNVSRVFD